MIEWLLLKEVESTQDVARELVSSRKDGSGLTVVFAEHQTRGRGRFDRVWSSKRGSSLTLSIICWDEIGLSQPWISGMKVACATAAALHLKLWWPNDLVLAGRKVGGVLTELCNGPMGAVPVVGLGVNLLGGSYPEEIRDRATCLEEHRESVPGAQDAAKSILTRLEELEGLNSWEELEPVWRLFDSTPGKQYTTPEGKEVESIGIDSTGALIASDRGDIVTVMAADAIFGRERATV